MRLTTTIHLWLSLLCLPRPAALPEKTGGLSLLQSEVATAEAGKKLKVKSEADLEGQHRPEARAEGKQGAKAGSKPKRGAKSEAKAQLTAKADRKAQRKAIADAKSDTEQGADAESANQHMGKGRSRKAEAGADAEAGTEAEQTVEAETDIQHKGKAETKRQHKAKAEAAAEQEHSQQRKAEADAEGKQKNTAEANVQVEAEAGTNSKQGVEGEAAIQHMGKGRRKKEETGAETEAGTEAEQGVDAETEEDAEGKQKNKADANVQVETEAGTEAEQSVDTEAEVEAEGELENKAEANVQVEADAKGKQKNTAEANVQMEAEAGTEAEQAVGAEANMQRKGKRRMQKVGASAEAEAGAEAEEGVEVEAGVQHKESLRRLQQGKESAETLGQSADTVDGDSEEAPSAGEDWPKLLKVRGAKAKHAGAAGADGAAGGSRQLAASKAARRQKAKAGADFVPNWVRAQETQETDLQKRLGSTPGSPEAPGCYVWAPTGCPNHLSFVASTWQHDSFGEDFGGAKQNESLCSDMRGQHFRQWCGSDDVQMLWIAEDAVLEQPETSMLLSQETPQSSGCYVQLPLGCPRHPTFKAERWTIDPSWDIYEETATRQTCDRRGPKFAHWCGAQEGQVKMLFVQVPSNITKPPAEPSSRSSSALPVAPSEPGCYSFVPYGCPKHPQRSSSSWKKEAYPKAGENQGVCEARERALMKWCGTSEVKMLFVHDVLADESSEVEQSEQEKYGSSAGEPASAGATAAEVATAAEAPAEPDEFMPTAMEAAHPEVPAEPGCYVFTPQGCPQNGLFEKESITRWVRDVYGEKHMGAGTDRAVCEGRGKNHYAPWCGTPSVETVFVAGAGGTSEAPGELWVPDAGAQSGTPSATGEELPWQAPMDYADERNRLAHTSSKRTRIPEAESDDERALTEAEDVENSVAKEEQAGRGQPPAEEAAAPLAEEAEDTPGDDAADQGGAKPAGRDPYASDPFDLQPPEGLPEETAAEESGGELPSESQELHRFVESALEAEAAKKSEKASQYSDEPLPALDTDAGAEAKPQYSDELLPALSAGAENESGASQYSDDPLPDLGEEAENTREETATEESGAELPSESEDGTAEKYSNEQLPSMSEDGTAEKYSDEELPSISEDVTAEQHSAKEPPSVDEAADQVWQRFQDAMAKPYSINELPSATKDEAKETPARQDFNGELSSVSQEKGPLLIHDDGYPELPGCYMRMPSGCPTKATTAQLWRHDVQAEQDNLTAAQCELRKPDWDGFCGVGDVQMVFVSLAQTGARVVSKTKASTAAEYSKEDLPSVSQEPTPAEGSKEEPSSESEDMDANPPEDENANPPEDKDAVSPAGEKDGPAEKYSNRELPSVSEDGPAVKYSNRELPSVSEDATAVKYSNRELPSVSEDTTVEKYSNRILPSVSEDATAEKYSNRELPSVSEVIKQALQDATAEKYSNRELPSVSEDATAEKYSNRDLPSVSKDATADKYSNRELPSVIEDVSAEKYSNRELPSVNEDATAAKYSNKELPAAGEEGVEKEEQHRLERQKAAQEKLERLISNGPGEDFQTLRDQQLKIHEALREKRLRGDPATVKHSMKELPYVDQEGERKHLPDTTYSQNELPAVDKDATATKYSDAELPSVGQDAHAHVPLPAEDGEAAANRYSTEALPSVDRGARHVTHSDEGLPPVHKAAQKKVDEHRQPPGLPKAGDLEDDMEDDLEVAAPEKATPGNLGPAEAPVRPHAVGGMGPADVAPQGAPAPVGPEPGAGPEDDGPPEAGDAPVLPADPGAKDLWEAKNEHFTEQKAKEAYKRIRASRAAQEQSQELARVWDPEMNLMLLGLAVWILGCVGISELRRVGPLKPAPKR